MKTFTLKISTPDGNVFEGEAEKFFAKGSEGELMIMADHVPFVTSVKSGEIRIYIDAQNVKSFNVSDGILSVSHNNAVLLTGNAVI